MHSSRLAGGYIESATSCSSDMSFEIQEKTFGGDV